MDGSQGNENGSEKKTFDELCAENAVELSEALAWARTAWAHMTQAEMAEAIGVSCSTLNKYENHKRRIPAYIVKRYSEISGISADRILKTAVGFRMKDEAKRVAAELPDLDRPFLNSLYDMIKAYKEKHPDGSGTA